MAKYIALIIEHQDQANIAWNVNEQNVSIPPAIFKSMRHFHDCVFAIKHHKTLVQNLVQDCKRHGVISPDLREFAFDYIQANPYYLHSGYTQERLARKIRHLDWTGQEIALLQNAILDRIYTPWRREFRIFCKLLPALETPKLIATIQRLSHSNRQDIAARASCALRHLK